MYMYTGVYSSLLLFAADNLVVISDGWVSSSYSLCVSLIINSRGGLWSYLYYHVT